MSNATNQFLCDCLPDRTCKPKICRRRRPKVASHLFSTVLVLSIMLYILCIPPIEAAVSKLDEESEKGHKDHFSRTENVIEEHKHDFDGETDSNKENVLHELATDNPPQTSETFDKSYVHEADGNGIISKDIGQDAELLTSPDDTQQSIGNMLKDIPQNAQQPHHTDSEEGDHKIIEDKGAFENDASDVGDDDLLGEFYSNLKMKDLASSEAVPGNSDSAAMSGDSLSESEEVPGNEKIASEEYNIQDSSSNFDGASTDSSFKPIEDNLEHLQNLDVPMADHRAGANTKENKESDEDALVTTFESRTLHNIANNEGDADPPERLLDNNVLQDSVEINSDDEGDVGLPVNVEDSIDLLETEEDSSEVPGLSKIDGDHDKTVNMPEKEEGNNEMLDSDKVERDHEENLDLPEKEDDSSKMAGSSHINSDIKENQDTSKKEDISNKIMDIKYETGPEMDSKNIKHGLHDQVKGSTEPSSKEKVIQINTNSKDPTSSQGDQNQDNTLIDSDGSGEKDKRAENENTNDLPNDHKDKDAKDIPGAGMWEEAEKLLNQSKKSHRRAYALLALAAELNHTKAMEKMSHEYLLADYQPRNLTKSIEIFQKLADKGSPIGQQGLAFMYGTGTGVKSSQAKALIYTTFAALGGGIMAQMMLGYRYWGGIGVVQNCETALTHYKKVSKKVAQKVQPIGSPAIHRIRLFDELEQGSSGGNLDDDLLQYYQFLADKGDVQAQVGLGQLYFQGARGVDVDHEKAFQYFKQAADAGNANAQAYLGKMYLEGESVVEQNNETALQYFKKAVEQGNSVGHSGMGLIYLRGKGVTKDYGKAINHFNVAAEQGWPEAQLQLGNIYYHGLGVSRDYQKAVKYFTLASQSGNLLAVYNLASMHAGGNGVLRSCHTATELFKSVAERGKWSSWFTEAYSAYKAGDIDTALIKYYLLAELGYEAAQSNVAYILEKGESTVYAKNESYARALLHWSRAASQGYTVARVKVGDYHFYGWGTPIDYEIAALHYRLASEQQNNAQAMFNLGYMHEQGLGLKKDIHLAKRFYDMAAESNPDAQVPVALAMVKLGAYFTLDWARKNYKFWEKFDVREVLGKDWDLYVITALAILLGFILFIRRVQA